MLCYALSYYLPPLLLVHAVYLDCIDPMKSAAPSVIYRVPFHTRSQRPSTQIKQSVTHGPKVWKEHTVGPLYSRSQGQCSTQIQHSYRCKSWNQPQELYTRSDGWHAKKLFNLPQVTNKCWTLLVPRLQKGYHQIWEANLHPWSNVPAFLNILTSISSIY
jgi:hypothetical protein